MRAEGLPASLGTAVQANLMGFPLDFVVPSIYLGGEPLKVVYISKVCRVTKRRALATIIVAKFQEFGGLVLGMIVATALFVWHTDYFTRRNEVLLIAAMGILAALFGLTLYAFAGHLKPIIKIIPLLARFHVFQRQLTQLRTLAEELEALIHAAFTNRVRHFVLAQAITCLSAVSVFIRPWIFFQALPGPGIGFDQLCVLFVLTHLVNAFSVIPGGLGLFEATMAGYATAAGLGDDKGAAFAMVNRIADLTLLVIGCWLIVYYGLSQVARGKEEARASEETTEFP